MLGWRDTPVYASSIGRVARASQPYIQQIFVGRPSGMDEDAFERKLYVVRKRAENEVREIGDGRRGNVLYPLALLPDHCLQRPAAGFPDHQVLPRTRRS